MKIFAALFLFLLIMSCSNSWDCSDPNINFECLQGNSVRFNIEDKQLPIVPATIGDEELFVLLDSGAVTTIISSSFLGETDKVQVSFNEFCLEDLCFGLNRGYAWDTLFSNTDPNGFGIQGVVGMGMLRYFVFDLEYGESAALFKKGIRCEGYEMPLRYDSENRPVVDVLIDGMPLENVLLDTGAVYCLVANEELLEQYVRENEIESVGCSINGCSNKFLSSVSEFCVFDVCESVEIKYPVFNAVGNSFFSKFHVQFDFVADSMIFCDR